jgi:hypothetical protein
VHIFDERDVPHGQITDLGEAFGILRPHVPRSGVATGKID